MTPSLDLADITAEPTKIGWPAARTRQQRWYWFSSAVVLAILVRLACFTGLIASDDLAYSRFAQQIAHRNFVLVPLHFALRFGLIIPVSWSYQLFGVGEWSTVLLPLMASVGSVILLMIIGNKLFGREAALVAGLLLATFPLAIRFSTILVPEPIAEFYLLLGVLAYVYARDQHGLSLGLLAGICLGVAYLTKETAAFVVPALLIDASIARRWRIACGLALGAFLMVAVEHSYYVLSVGDLLFRPHALGAHNHSPAAIFVSQHLTYRLFKAYPHMVLVPSIDMGLHSVLAVAAGFAGLRLLPSSKTRMLFLWALLPLMYVNFGTTGFAHYIPLPIEERYIGFLYGPMFLVAGGIFAQHLWSRAGSRWIAVSVLAIVAVFGFCCAYQTRTQGYKTDDVKALRLLAMKVEAAHVTGIKFEEDKNERWQQTMAILDPGLRNTSGALQGAVTIKPDLFGLPSVACNQNRVSEVTVLPGTPGSTLPAAGCL